MNSILGPTSTKGLATMPSSPLSSAMGAGALIQTEVTGQVVTGVIICRTSYAVEVGISSPYQNLTSGCRFPRLPNARLDFLGSDGDSTAEWLLRDCYQLGAFLERNLPRLQAAWQQHLEVLASMATPVLYEREDFLIWRRGMRGLLRSGLTTQAWYQAELRKVRRASDAFEASFWRGKIGFFQLHFPIFLAHMDLQAQVVPILEGRVTLRAGL